MITFVWLRRAGLAPSETADPRTLRNTDLVALLEQLCRWSAAMRAA